MTSNITQALVPQLQPPKRDAFRRKFNQSDDNSFVKQAKETHNSDGQYVDVSPVLAIVETIFRLVAPGIDSVIKGTTEEAYVSEDKISATSFGEDVLDGLSNVIHKISCEIFCKCSGGDAHGSTMAIFKMLSNYPWEAKVVLTLAGFSVTYGEFWLVAQLCTTTPLAKSVAHLKQVSGVIENSQSLKPQIDAINALVSAILDVTKRITEFYGLPTEYLSHDSAQVSVFQAHVPAAAYWTVRSIVACAFHVSTLTDTRYETMGVSNNEMWELSSFTHKLINIRDLLTTELESCKKYIAERRYEEEYRTLIKLIDSTHLDNVKILRALISTREDKPLFFGSQNTAVSIETLRRKHVLLLISDLDISHEEILVLYNIYEMRAKPELHYDHHTKETPYEIVWIPVVDRVESWTDGHQRKFSELLAQMPWHAVHSPAIIEPHVTKYIREKWNFDKKMIIVSLDPFGKVSSSTAMDMMWIWGNTAFPFSHEREELLWSSESWTLKLVIDGIDPHLLQWSTEEKYVCLYGGDDLEWIREFTRRAKAMAEYLKISMEMIYVGKSNVPKERLNRVKTVIETEKLSRYWPDHVSTWFFWSRIDSIRRSKVRYGKTIDNDPVLKEAMVLLSYDGGEQGWAMLWLGASKMARANGQLTLVTLREFEQWQTEADRIGLLPALEVELQRRHTPQHCTRLILPGIGKDVPQKVTCTECGREMEKFFMFRCCTD